VRTIILQELKGINCSDIIMCCNRLSHGCANFALLSEVKNKIKKTEMGRAFSTYGREKRCIQGLGDET
jgi:hypothetical protein